MLAINLLRSSSLPCANGSGSFVIGPAILTTVITMLILVKTNSLLPSEVSSDRTWNRSINCWRIYEWWSLCEIKIVIIRLRFVMLLLCFVVTRSNGLHDIHIPSWYPYSQIFDCLWCPKVLSLAYVMERFGWFESRSVSYAQVVDSVMYRT